MPDQILVLRETARVGPGNGGGRPPLPPGSKLAVYGDSLSNRVTWQPTVAAHFGIPWSNGGIGSTRATDNGPGSGSNEARLGPFINNTAATVGINTIWFGYNDWAASPQVDIGTDAEFAKPLATRDRNTFKGALSYIVERLYTAKPEALHILVTVPGSRWEDGRTHDFVQAALDVANSHAVPYINMYTEAGINAWNYASFYVDHVHVDSTDSNQDRFRRGASRWANVFINKIEAYYRATTIVPASAEMLTAEVGPLDPPPSWAIEQPQTGSR